MNGYLQRLVAFELNSASSIHPIVGSFFSAPRHERTPESSRQEEHQWGFREERNIPYLDRTEEAVVPPPAARPSPFESKCTDLRHMTLLPEPTSPKSQSPLADRTLNRVDERLIKPPGTTEQRESPKEPVTPATPELRRFDAVSEKWPLIAEAVSPAKPKDPSRDRLYPFPTDPKWRMSDGEPDEIQIHIGRIEVTAVPPAPAIRPAPKPPRHVAPSLDEYLRRQDRRTQ